MTAAPDWNAADRAYQLHHATCPTCRAAGANPNHLQRGIPGRPVAHGIPLDMAVVTNALDHLRRMQVVAPSQRRDRRVSDAELDQIEGWWRGMQRWDETTRGGRWWA